MDNFTSNDWIIGYTTPIPGDTRPKPKPTAIEVGPWPDKTGWSRKYDLTTGCCYTAYRELPEEEQAQRLLNEAAHISFQGMPAEDVLEELSKIRIWREMGIKLIQGDAQHAFYEPRGYQFWNPYNP